jgi:hypothetical protein
MVGVLVPSEENFRGRVRCVILLLGPSSKVHAHLKLSLDAEGPLAIQAGTGLLASIVLAPAEGAGQSLRGYANKSEAA